MFKNLFIYFLIFLNKKIHLVNSDIWDHEITTKKTKSTNLLTKPKFSIFKAFIFLYLKIFNIAQISIITF